MLGWLLQGNDHMLLIDFWKSKKNTNTTLTQDQIKSFSYGIRTTVFSNFKHIFAITLTTTLHNIPCFKHLQSNHNSSKNNEIFPTNRKKERRPIMRHFYFHPTTQESRYLFHHIYFILYYISSINSLI